MICPNCKNNIDDNTNYCINCGSQLLKDDSNYLDYQHCKTSYYFGIFGIVLYLIFSIVNIIFSMIFGVFLFAFLLVGGFRYSTSLFILKLLLGLVYLVLSILFLSHSIYTAANARNNKTSISMKFLAYAILTAIIDYMLIHFYFYF